MARKKKDICESNEYKQFKERIMLEDPYPYFCLKEEIALFPEFKKEFSDASLHKNTLIGTAVCMNKTSRFILGFEMLGASKTYAYLSGSMLLDNMEEAETEGTFLINEVLKGG